MLAALALGPVLVRRGHVIALAVDADDQTLVAQGRQRSCRGAVADLLFLGEGQDGWHPASQNALLDLIAQQRRQLLVQRYWRVVINHVMQLSPRWSTRDRRGLPVCTRVYT